MKPSGEAQLRHMTAEVKKPSKACKSPEKKKFREDLCQAFKLSEENQKEIEGLQIKLCALYTINGLGEGLEEDIRAALSQVGEAKEKNECLVRKLMISPKKRKSALSLQSRERRAKRDR